MHGRLEVLSVRTDGLTGGACTDGRIVTTQQSASCDDELGILGGRGDFGDATMTTTTTTMTTTTMTTMLQCGVMEKGEGLEPCNATKIGYGDSRR